MKNNTVKIGYTGNVRQRMQTISSSSGLEIVNGYITEFVDSELVVNWINIPRIYSIVHYKTWKHVA